MMKVVQLVTYYAPIAFFGFFANLVATYGSQIDQGHVMVCENCKKTQRVLTVKHKTSERLSILLSEK